MQRQRIPWINAWTRWENLPLWWGEDGGWRVVWCFLSVPPHTRLAAARETPKLSVATSTCKHFLSFLCVFSSPSCVLAPSLSLSVPDLAFQTLSCQGSPGVHRTMWTRCGAPEVAQPGFFAVCTLLPLFLLLYAHFSPATGTLKISSSKSSKSWGRWLRQLVWLIYSLNGARWCSSVTVHTFYLHSVAFWKSKRTCRFSVSENMMHCNDSDVASLLSALPRSSSW